MANEITEGLTFSVTKDGSNTQTSVSKTRTQSGSLVQKTKIQLATGGSTALHGLVAAPCQLIVVNLDTTNYVTISTDDANSVGVIRIPALRTASIPVVSGNAYYGRANTAACYVEVTAASD